MKQGYRGAIMRWTGVALFVSGSFVGLAMSSPWPIVSGLLLGAASAALAPYA